jgi:Calcineurin-like phosphoesterase
MYVKILIIIMAILLALSSFASFSLAWRAAILTDVHIDPTY